MLVTQVVIMYLTVIRFSLMATDIEMKFCWTKYYLLPNCSYAKLIIINSTGTENFEAWNQTERFFGGENPVQPWSQCVWLSPDAEYGGFCTIGASSGGQSVRLGLSEWNQRVYLRWTFHWENRPPIIFSISCGIFWFMIDMINWKFRAIPAASQRFL